MLAWLFAAAAMFTNVCVADVNRFVRHTPYSARGRTLLLWIHGFVCCCLACLLLSLFALAFVLVSINFHSYAYKEIIGVHCIHQQQVPPAAFKSMLSLRWVASW